MRRRNVAKRNDRAIRHPPAMNPLRAITIRHTRLGLGREADTLREQQRRLRKELQEAKAVIGQVDDARAICHDTKTTGISQATLVDTLRQ
ncbi:hypothetical protein TELCIR_23880, partial [Teladorsagia circumcincta]